MCVCVCLGRECERRGRERACTAHNTQHNTQHNTWHNAHTCDMSRPHRNEYAGDGSAGFGVNCVNTNEAGWCVGAIAASAVANTAALLCCVVLC